MTDDLHSLGRSIDYPATIPSGLALFGPEEWRRRVADHIEHEPTEADWKAYNRAVSLLSELRDNPFFDEGGDDYGSSVAPPRTRVEIIYAETHEEWEKRVIDMAFECGGFPQRDRGRPINYSNISAPATASDLLYSPKGPRWTHKTGLGSNE